MTKKKLKVIIISIMVIVIGFNIVWLGVNYYTYEPFVRNMPKTHGVYVKTTKAYNLSVKKPDYPQFTGNLAISNRKNDLAFIIWPYIFTNAQIGLQITDKNNANYSVMLDNKLHYLPNKTDDAPPKKEIEQLLEERHQEIVKMYQYALKTWHFDK